MKTCKFCDSPIFWNQEKSIMGEVWRAYDDEGLTNRHQCEDYKPKSKGLKLIQAEAKLEKQKEWGRK